MGVTVSVVIPTYERSWQTSRAVKSVLQQDVPPEAVFVVDDGSSDECMEELRSCLPEDLVTLVFLEHSGHPGRVRDAGVQLAKTSHVAFLDSDDQWLPGKLRYQRALAEKGVRAQGSGYLTGSVSAKISIPNDGPVEVLHLKDLLRENQICNSSVLVERDLLCQIGGLPTSFGIRGIEDYVAWLRIATLSDWYYSLTPLVIYSDDPENSMRSTNVFSIPERDLAALDLFHWFKSHHGKVPRPLSAMQRAYSWMQRSWLGRNGFVGK